MMEQDNSKNEKDQKLQRVRRRLFADDHDEEGGANDASNENLANKLLEEIRKDTRKMGEKWNFDFINERPLPGPWEYVRPDEEFSDNLQTDDNNGHSNDNLNNVEKESDDNQLTKD